MLETHEVIEYTQLVETIYAEQTELKPDPLTTGEIGLSAYAGYPFRLKGETEGARFAAPCLGQHSEEVLRDVLGLSAREIGEAIRSGTVRLSNLEQTGVEKPSLAIHQT